MSTCACSKNEEGRRLLDEAGTYLTQGQFARAKDIYKALWELGDSTCWQHTAFHSERAEWVAILQKAGLEFHRMQFMDMATDAFVKALDLAINLPRTYDAETITKPLSGLIQNMLLSDRKQTAAFLMDYNAVFLLLSDEGRQALTRVLQVMLYSSHDSTDAAEAFEILHQLAGQSGVDKDSALNTCKTLTSQARRKYVYPRSRTLQSLHALREVIEERIREKTLEEDCAEVKVLMRMHRRRRQLGLGNSVPDTLTNLVAVAFTSGQYAAAVHLLDMHGSISEQDMTLWYGLIGQVGYETADFDLACRSLELCVRKMSALPSEQQDWHFDIRLSRTCALLAIARTQANCSDIESTLAFAEVAFHIHNPSLIRANNMKDLVFATANNYQQYAYILKNKEPDSSDIEQAETRATDYFSLAQKEYSEDAFTYLSYANFLLLKGSYKDARDVLAEGNGALVFMCSSVSFHHEEDLLDDLKAEMAQYKFAVYPHSVLFYYLTYLAEAGVPDYAKASAVAMAMEQEVTSCNYEVCSSNGGSLARDSEEGDPTSATWLQARSLSLLGYVNRRSHRHQAALRAFQSALRIQPDYSVAKENVEVETRLLSQCTEPRCLNKRRRKGSADLTRIVLRIPKQSFKGAVKTFFRRKRDKSVA